MTKRSPKEHAAHKKALYTLLTENNSYYGSFDADKLASQYAELYKNFLEGRERFTDMRGNTCWTYAKDDPRRWDNDR